ncbi:hypothetical protein [Streptosporangium lutulentum]|uniref:Uncharacterized protein n=1 Tax=Streptosporangium lutulentum TaxID=1461250 RepID=A0ABT9Q5H6_9ACTN|nr:hypothetical protein [Streptosporangium lutulentum]MDP9841988.1 hypothetical protein [Streptosporangium lutulentum]
MKPFLVGVTALAGMGVVRWLTSRRPKTWPQEGRGIYRWLPVTINRRPEDVAPDGLLPEPLAMLGDAVEVRIREAPGDKGTEIAARLRAPLRESGGMMSRLTHGDPRREIREALRETKSLIETGEVLRPEEPPVTRPVPRGDPPDRVAHRAGGEERR